MATMSGDRGRDGELYIPDEEPEVAVQYSVTQDWTAKIRATVRRISETMPGVRRLVYATNQDIGAKADDLRTELRIGHGIHLDINDRSWFTERELSHPQRQAAAEELSQKFVDPLLSRRGIEAVVAPSLERHDAKLALLHLTLDNEDKATGKGLTKSCFESLVLAQLHDTDTDNRLKASEIEDAVVGLLGAGNPTQVRALVRSALNRLSAKQGPVNHHRSTDDYCLSHAENLQLRQNVSQFILDEQSLEGEIQAAISEAIPDIEVGGQYALQAAKDLRYAIENVLVRRGEGFASAVATGEVQQIEADEIFSAASDAKADSLTRLTKGQTVEIVCQVLDQPSESTQRHLRRLADAYTLFAFLRETPDVQKVVVKMFSDGDLWLDTTVILPLLAETLLLDRQARHYTVLLRAALDAGLRLYVTDGVIEEVERHINKCLSFSRIGAADWRSASVPFLYSVYASTGRSRLEFASWLNEFRGQVRPMDDVRDLLREDFGIRHRNLTDLSDGAPLELRAAVQEIWNEVHEKRRANDREEIDATTRQRLVAHDVENCVGVMQLRRQEPASPMGYRSWWVTLDRTAFSLAKELTSRLGPDAPRSPALSPDFLTEFLRLGPLRSQIEKDMRDSLPLLTDISRSERLPKDLVALADRVRAECAGWPERQIRREVRDALDTARLQIGSEARGGLKKVEERLIQRISAQREPSDSL
ncbi:hypothetical protein JOF29_005221 [Kribbella aluminosa]|uniref:KAP NTPase domain-containing protein n=1 Tax=Kribbella aluminosa TaxID=416017 RepID=A0ABS4UR42_9ACTN|nr:hypothetical protein [Kribbella aluminosa]MBP2354111.1 hypothetical protein [Kribbella aluminosa]